MSSSSIETLIDVTMPQMGVSVAEGTVVEWKKQVGDWVEADEIIAAISTDKIDTDVEAPATGRVAEIVVDVGATVDVGTVMARIATDAKPGEAHMSENSSAADPGLGTGEAAAAVQAPGEAGELSGDTTTEHAGTTQRPTRAAGRRYSPGGDADRGRARRRPRAGRGHRPRRARQQEGRARVHRRRQGGAADAHREPVPARRAGRAAAAQAAPGSASKRRPRPGQPLSRMRQAIGSRMVQSLQTAATCTTIAEADMTRIEAARKKAGLNYLPYQARAAVETLLEFPELNATLEDDDHAVYTDAVHLGIAVSLGEGGLIVPVIRDAQDLSVEGLAKRIKDLAKRARANELSADEVRGGTFTITNPGGYGSIMATPVINLPQVAILDTEAVVKRPVVITDELGNDSIAIRSMTYLCMSWDHRALDGALAAQFLTALRKRLEAWPIT